MHTRQNYGGLDRFRIIAALLVVAIHTSPLASVSEGADFFLTRILARTAVPFFFMVTGQFVAAGFLTPSVKSTARFHKYLLKTILLYLFCIILYLPVGIYAGHYKALNAGLVFRMLLFDGTFYHLWYFPACILGILLVWLMSLRLKLRGMTVACAVLYLIGLFGDSYFALIRNIPALNAVYEFGFRFFSYTRNGLFLAPLFLVLGIWAAKTAHSEQADSGVLVSDLVSLACFFIILVGEAFILRHFELQRHDSMYLALVPVMFFLYRCLLLPRSGSRKELRTASAWIYILHPAVIVAVRGIAKPLKLTALLVENSIVHYLAVAILSVAAGFLITFIQKKLSLSSRLHHGAEAGQITGKRKKSKKPSPLPEDVYMEEDPEYDLSQKAEMQEVEAMQDLEHQDSYENWGEESALIPDAALVRDKLTFPENPDSSRAWIEIDADALAHNVAFFRSRLPGYCRLMPAVKAEAYGHGAVITSRLLNDLGVDAFCVACACEGAALREAGIEGEILILGYTPPADFPRLRRYRLTQTVIDYPYAQELNQFEEEIHVHIGLDTGMHRVGIRCENIEEIIRVYQMENLKVDGLFTHLCASDSPHPDHKAFTYSQIRAFYQVVDILKAQGYPCHGLHLLASYGILNLLQDNIDPNVPEACAADSEPRPDPRSLAAEYVRPGIALYGVLSNQNDQNVWKDYLWPVLSLKARITSIRPLYAGESVGYGITYTAERDMRIAAVSIGYADGLPRELSNGKGAMLLNGRPAPIIGRICMDQTIIDISDIPDVRRGDAAVIIGRSGTVEITACQIADRCGTITHEILTGLAGRLDRIIV